MKNTVRLLCVALMLLLVFAGLVACSHKEAADHTATGDWLSDATHHWHACEKEKCADAGDRAEHVYDNACDTDCNVCGATREITHVYDKTVANSDYLKAAATATTKAQYWKSCACGAKSDTEYFESDKTAGTLANIQDLSKTYDAVALANPTYETNSDGAVTVEWYQGNTKLPAAPVNAGTYKVKVIIAESATYAGVSAEKEFTIAKKAATFTTAPTMSAVTIKYSENYGVNYTTDGDGAVTVEYKVRGAADSTYSATAPLNKGLYTARVSVAEGANYTAVSATVDYEIEAFVFSSLSTNVAYSGSNTHEINLSTFGYNNVKLRVTFNNDGKVGATPTSVTVLENDEPTVNYVVDINTCTVNIVAKTLSISWTAPANLVYDGTAKLPTATLTNLVTGDDCTAVVEVAEGSNVNAGKFKSRVMSLMGEDADNYAIPLNPTSKTSPEYTITPKTLTVPALSKDYNGSNAVSYTFTTADGLLEGDSCTLTFDAADTSNAAAIAVGHYANAKMSNALLSNGNYMIDVNTCDLHILDTADLILLATDRFNIETDYIIVVEVKQGTVKVGDSIVLPGTPDKVYEVLAIDKDRELVEYATVGDAVGLCVDGMAELTEVSAPDFLYEAGNIPEMATEFLAKAYLKTQDEGGRRLPVSDGYRPQFRGLGLSQTAIVTLIEYYGVAANAGVWTPGETMLIKITLTTPVPAALLHGLEFTMSESDNSVITGVVVDGFIGSEQAGNNMLLTGAFNTQALTPIVVKITNTRTTALDTLELFVSTGSGSGNYLTDFTIELYDEDFEKIEGTHNNTEGTFTKGDSTPWSLAAGETCYVVVKTTNATNGVFVRLM
ncbi:MAG: hypothetical protein IJW22_09720 [Clostridia bacterium]|nr:hypothetical protein [Clostridia bacterium]